MTRIKKALCLMTAVTAFAAAGCSAKDGGSEKKPDTAKDSPQTDSDNASAEDNSADTQGSADSSSETEAISPVLEDYQSGELLAETAEIFGGDYTYQLNVTYSDAPDTVCKLLQVCSGDNFYMSVKEKNSEGLPADTVYLRLGDTAYDIDNNIGAYSPAVTDRGLNLIANIIDMRLDRTATHIPQDTEGYTVEEYTYTGNTYITVYDFYFDENRELKKYTAAYTVEGQDELVETAEVLKLERTADEKYFSEDIFDGLDDFTAMSEDERLAFCQALCGRFQISTDNMYEMNITTDALKRISFEEFSLLVYGYAKAEQDSEYDADTDTASEAQLSDTSEAEKDPDS